MATAAIIAAVAALGSASMGAQAKARATNASITAQNAARENEASLALAQGIIGNATDDSIYGMASPTGQGGGLFG
jgi:hypothetical protein